MSLNAIAANQLDQIGSTTGKYFKYDEGLNQWSIVEMNCLQKFIRRIGLGYGSTTLKHIAVQIGKEDLDSLDGIDISLKNRIHQLWQKTYSNDRNPLRMDRYTKVDDKVKKLVGNVLWERLKVGDTEIHLSASNLTEINCKFGGNNVQPRDMFFMTTDSNEDKINKLLSQLETTECAGKSVLTFTWKLYDSFLSMRDTTQLVLNVIECYLAAHTKTVIKIVIINFDLNLPGTFIEAIDACRSMRHPHAQFIDIR